MGNINFGKKVNLKAFEDLIKEAGKKYVIRVGIIGKNASEIHDEKSGRTNAQIGAAHEFGATINHPGGQPYYINSSTGLAIFVKKDSLFGKHLIEKGQVTKPHTIILPTRSFLRMPLLSAEGKKAIIKSVLTDKKVGPDGKYMNKTREISESLSEYTNLATKKDENTVIYREAVKKFIDKDIIAMLPERIAAAALERVQESFKTGGFGKWAPITNYTKKHRINSPNSEPLNDTTKLYKSITAEIKEVS